MDDIKQAELLKSLDDLRAEVRDLKMENMKLKVAMDDYGIEDEDIEEIPDAEVIAMQQLEILRERSDQGISFEKEDADIFKILTKALMDIRGGTIKRAKKSPKGKDLEAEELLKQLKVLKGGKV